MRWDANLSPRGMAQMHTRGKALILGLLVAVPAALAAQNSGTVQATATVLTPISENGEQDLQFGNVFPGLDKSVLVSDLASAGRFQVTGEGVSQVALSFTLPASLTSGGNALPIVFGASDAAYGPDAGTQSATFDPSAVSNQNLVGGALYVWIAGTVQPAIGQLAGNYSADVTLTVTYTGS